MKVIFDELNEFKTWIIVNHTVLTDKPLAEILGEHYHETGELDVAVTVNGHDVNFERFIDEFEKQLDDMVERKAREIVKDKLRSISDRLYSMAGSLDWE